MKSKILTIASILICLFGYSNNNFIRLTEHNKKHNIKLLTYNDIPHDLPPYLIGAGVICFVMAASFTDQQNMLSPIGVKPTNIPNSSKWLIGVGGGMVVASFVLQIDF